MIPSCGCWAAVGWQKIWQLHWNTAIFRAEWIPDFSQELWQDTLGNAWFAQRHMPPSRVEQTVQGICVYGQEALLLQIQEGSGAFLANQQLLAENHRVLRYSKILAQARKVTHYLKDPISK